MLAVMVSTEPRSEVSGSSQEKFASEEISSRCVPLSDSLSVVTIGDGDLIEGQSELFWVEG